ncbi:hypothetical protein [Leptospira yasudae]|uniref:Uncharacterized protein n=1 Tax=Leptospira yasudae TaxID=2202201 RepID=A0A6N4QRY8_9LEPT|nr:hypothetical protein [Leptospira yasudae]TGL75985.1 hypothetical protein EHQ72_14445 [Leptospira yasudae]TGL79743.1 hypothetical protein EHQ83_17905 [Leptospira yasudae]TGL80101.1 hypothetical protein EHQ77_08960 [Leptospira yasudae]
MDRIQEKYVGLFDYSNLILVQCPKCKHKAEVLNESEFRNNRKVHCNHCGFIKTEEDNYWNGTYMLVAQRCPVCGNRHFYRKSNVKLKSTKEVIKSVSCSKCQKTSKVKLDLIREVSTYKVTDPYFGLSLWLQKTVNNHTLWFYNYEHLQDIKEYIQAGLREKIPDNKRTMFTKLPKWIKSAKQREKIIESIVQLEKV